MHVFMHPFALYKTDINLQDPAEYQPLSSNNISLVDRVFTCLVIDSTSKSKTTPVQLTTFVTMPRYQIGGYNTVAVQ